MVNGERLTPRWTKTTEEAFGPRGKQGRDAELFLLKVLSEQFKWEVQDHETIREDQVSGVDVAFKAPHWANWYTADVKGNLQENGRFYVDTSERGWLFDSKKISHRIWHVNPKTGWMAWYDRNHMKKYVKEQGYFNCGLLRIELHDKIDFITRRKVRV